MYKVFFEKDNLVVKMPLNPSSLKISSLQEMDKFHILKQGNVVIPKKLDLRVFSFEAELPSRKSPYVEHPYQIGTPDYYLRYFKKWREEKQPVRFLVKTDDLEEISVKVYVESLQIRQEIGFEDAYLVQFQLVEYRPFGLKTLIKNTGVEAAVQGQGREDNRSVSSTYVVKKGDNLTKIAANLYGNSSRYREIYEANRDMIKNPNLIYPGQVLRIPAK